MHGRVSLLTPHPMTAGHDEFARDGKKQAALTTDTFLKAQIR